MLFYSLVIKAVFSKTHDWSAKSLPSLNDHWLSLKSQNLIKGYIW